MRDIDIWIEAGHRVMERRRPSEQEVLDWLVADGPDHELTEEEADTYRHELWDEIETEYNKLRGEVAL